MSNNADHQVSRQGLLFIVSAPSGAGKTSLLKAAIGADKQLTFSVSYTTRPPRSGEVDGRDYHFISHQGFASRLADGDFLEHAEVFGNQYGTSRSATEQALSNSRDLVLEIDWQGAQKVRDQGLACLSIFIMPPSLHELQQRLQRRGKDSADVIKRRMAQAKAEMSHWQEYDYLIVNDDFAVAAEQLASIFVAARLQRTQQGQRIHSILENL